MSIITRHTFGDATIRPRGRRLLVKVDPPKTEHHGLALPATQSERAEAKTATVVEVGTEEFEGIKKGARILLTPWAGSGVSSCIWDDGLVLVNDYEVWAELS